MKKGKIIFIFIIALGFTALTIYILDRNKNKAPEEKIINKLQSLEIKDHVIEFDPDVYEYYVSITDEVTSFEITTKALNEKSLVEIIGNEDLKNGSIVKVKVSAGKNSLAAIYQIKIKTQ